MAHRNYVVEEVYSIVVVRIITATIVITIIIIFRGYGEACLQAWRNVVNIIIMTIIIIIVMFTTMAIMIIIIKTTIVTVWKVSDRSRVVRCSREIWLLLLLLSLLLLL